MLCNKIARCLLENNPINSTLCFIWLHYLTTLNNAGTTQS
ncbi:hypothetical protein HMPREF1586_00993 [Gardnerella vaginalis JCP8522]|nr:hypothetical protein HMPREF1586_00993 [Gardnerella vaginalis JCP8522]